MRINEFLLSWYRFIGLTPEAEDREMKEDEIVHRFLRDWIALPLTMRIRIVRAMIDSIGAENEELTKLADLGPDSQTPQTE